MGKKEQLNCVVELTTGEPPRSQWHGALNLTTSIHGLGRDQHTFSQHGQRDSIQAEQLRVKRLSLLGDIYLNREAIIHSQTGLS